MILKSTLERDINITFMNTFTANLILQEFDIFKIKKDIKSLLEQTLSTLKIRCNSLCKNIEDEKFEKMKFKLFLALYFVSNFTIKTKKDMKMKQDDFSE